MSGASKTRTRQERIDSLGIQKPRLIQWWQNGDKTDFSIRIDGDHIRHRIAGDLRGVVTTVCFSQRSNSGKGIDYPD